MPLYTFIADYDGGTYISQVAAENPTAALAAWAQQLQVDAIKGFGPGSKARLIEDLRQDEKEGMAYVAIGGLKNVWCAMFLVRGKMPLVNFVPTQF